MTKAMIARAVAHGLWLFLSGRFMPPRLEMVDSFVRTSLVSISARGQADDYGVARAVTEADLFAQAVEQDILRGKRGGNYAEVPDVALHRAFAQSDLWRGKVVQIVGILMRDGLISSQRFDALIETGD
jgi:hypothetical protein